MYNNKYEIINAKEIAQKIKEFAAHSTNEEELKIKIEYLLRTQILDKWQIPWASYEHRTLVSGVRKDALYGTVIIEYKAPGKLSDKNQFENFKVKVKQYITDEAKDERFYNRYFGVLLDGEKIAFIRFRKGKWEEPERVLDVNPYTILRLLEAIRGLTRKPVDAEFLLQDFGPKSIISKNSISSLYHSLKNSKSPRTKMLFEDWRTVFSQICAYSPEKLKGLIKHYEIDEKNADVEKILFSVHTYYTILMKLLTTEIVTLFADSIIGSYLKRIEEAYYHGPKEMCEELKELEEGGLFYKLGIKNFLEADYFAWYLDEWNDKIAFSISEIVKKLMDYEPATVELNPECVKDLFKRLYQNLVPRDVRHKLGEYFTPDWLAELLLNEIEYDGNPEKSVFDPACGSGTFLVLAIKRVKEYSEEHFLDKRVILNEIIKKIKGIDLNPLAVLASKANYIIALADLLRYKPREGIEIPVYLADSIFVGRKEAWQSEFDIQKKIVFDEYAKEEWEAYITTNEGQFWMPMEVIDKGQLSNVLDLMNECLKNKYTLNEFEKSLKSEFEFRPYAYGSLQRLYKKILNLERYNKNRIWTRLLKNRFAPLFIGKFDFVLGNPPWINWENLPEYHRKGNQASLGLLWIIRKN
ncbi:MAG: N-6 DNA methylase [candidate division WOR-3 bacterium]